MNPSTKGNLYIFITALLWSIGGVLIRFVPGNAVAINGVRSLIALFFFFAYRKSFRIRINRKIVLAGICLMLTNTFYAMANKLTTAGNAIVLQYLAPVFVLIWNSVYQKKMPSFRHGAIVLMAFCGMVLFFFDKLDGGKLLGNILATCAGICFSGVFFINSLDDASPEDANMIAFALSFVISIPFLGQLNYMNLSSDAALLVLGVVQIGLAYAVYSKGIRLTSPVSASLISLTEAVLNPLWVYLAYGEKLGQYALMGAAIIMIAVIANTLSSINVGRT